MSKSRRVKEFKFIDLFAGIGGFHIAMHAAGGKCVFASELDKFARQTYEYNFRKMSPEIFKNGNFNEDITDPKLNYKKIPDFDILCAGFPCQPFSFAGKNEGFKDKTRGTLFFSILSILEAKKPKAFLLENVKGLKSHDDGRTLKTIIESLEKIGYKVKWRILDSLDFGVPQKRERWYCVGIRDENNFEFPKGKKEIVKLSSIVDLKDQNPALKLPNQEIKRIEYHFKKMKGLNRVQHDNSQYAPTTKKGRHGVFSFQKADGSLRFHIGDVAKTQIQEAFYCCLETYAPTIIFNRVPKLWDIRRKLSVIECQRLQGFPDKFSFPVSDNQAYRQLGNSIVLPVVREITKSLIKTLNNENK
ncbi:MAG TPA: DNA (cytosine-5-)-methyltransferase [Bacteroidia bacterium]|nr:DNA (cytosine-5-)-methyltransferase [Bacteroidia bacterium]HRH07882.1 DNA (cytosine-5-)-methyltransferase [Bacteroidia bacterium]